MRPLLVAGSLASIDAAIDKLLALVYASVSVVVRYLVD